MTLRDLTRAEWAHMGDDVACRECEALARRLPHGLRFDGLRDHAYCGQTHRVARFSRREAGDPVHFVLLPGGEASLGYDGSRFRPTRWQIQSFQGWPEEMVRRGFKESDVKWWINDYVDWETSSPRTVRLSSMLIEVEARPVAPRDDAELLDESDPRFKQLIDRCEEEGEWDLHSGIPWEPSYHVELEGGAARVWRRQPTTIRYVEERLARSGMRLPACDEWEYACGAGATTLFRWGNESPCDFYPGDTCAEDRELKTAWALSAGRLKYEEPPPGWNLHTQPNLFGLRIAENPYDMEIVADAPWTLGGDGGCYICGGEGFFLGWLPLATAFRAAYCDTGFRPDRDNVADHYHKLRRVVPID